MNVYILLHFCALELKHKMTSEENDFLTIALKYTMKLQNVYLSNFGIKIAIVYRTDDYQ